MSNKSPAFQWYPKDILASARVQMMSLAEEGAYRRLLDFCWLNEYVPADAQRAARLIGKGCSPETAKIALEMFEPHPTDSDKMIHDRLEVERDKQKSNSEARSKASAARWNKQGTPADVSGKQVKSKADANALQTDMQNDALHTSSSTSIAREEKETTGVVSKKKKPTKLPNDFAVDEKMAEWAKENVPLLNFQHETKQFIDHYASKGETSLDWTARWRTWQRNAFTDFGKYPDGKPSLKQQNGATNGNSNGKTGTYQNGHQAPKPADTRSDEERLAFIGVRPKV